MELTLARFDATPYRTIGQLGIDGVFAAFTLEDPVHEGVKIFGETAIPQGRYQVVINRSVRFQRMLPLLLAVPGFSGIRIHAGNTSVDTAGCILVGLNRDVDSILQSQLALAAVQRSIAGALAKGDGVWITVEQSGIGQGLSTNATQRVGVIGHSPDPVAKVVPT